jgi:hypothetical protein
VYKKLINCKIHFHKTAIRNKNADKNADLHGFFDFSRFSGINPCLATLGAVTVAPKPGEGINKSINYPWFSTNEILPEPIK